MATITQKNAGRPAAPICKGSARGFCDRLSSAAALLACLPGFGPGLTAYNDAAPATPVVVPVVAPVWPILSAINVAVASQPDGDGKVKPWRLAPIGEYPVKLPDGRRIIQVVDKTAVEKMHAAFNSWLAKLGGVVGMAPGRPVYEGHPDAPSWSRENPGVRAKAVARIQSTEVRDDGLWGTPALNDAGRALLSGPAPAYAHHSPHWSLEPIAGRPGCFRPVDLVSIGLTNQPNLPPQLTQVAANEGGPQPTDTTMPPWLIALLAPLSITASSTQADIESALTKLMADNKAMKDKEAPQAAAATAAANEATALKAEIAGLRKSRAEVAVNSLLASGKLKEVDRTKQTEALTALNDTQFAAEVTKLTAVPSVINTAVFPHLAARRQESGSPTDKITAINEAVSKHMKDHGIKDRDIAWAAVKSAQPGLFA